MLMPHPAVLRRLVEEYEAAVAEDAAAGGGRPSTRAQDLAYTLCVSTGTRDVRHALRAAHRMLAAMGVAGPRTTGAPSVRPGPTEIGVP
ncbi:DUF5133 domain-containing protein [Streptomyces sediminimaris]|uniref:DUF5133 domain-containing protein n=1 Tax=Streptomyces sediminimaris TaxID=3383721 RepID=UPI00399A50DD